MGTQGHGTELGGQSVRPDDVDPVSRSKSDPKADSPTGSTDVVGKQIDPRKQLRRRRVLLNGITVSVSRPGVVDVVLSSAPAERLEVGSERTTVWAVVVWDDPVNLMSYVAYVFASHFGFTRFKAEQLMMLVHMEGRAVVASGGREVMEGHVVAMHRYGLLATLEQAG